MANSKVNSWRNILFLSGMRSSGRSSVLQMIKNQRVITWEGDDYLMVQRLRGTHSRIVLVEEDIPLTMIEAVAVRFPDAKFVVVILNSKLKQLYENGELQS